MGLCLGFLLLAGVLWGPIVSQVEQARYTIVESHGAIEIRDYASMIVAQTSVTGTRDTAISQGFRIIADYIFGNNTAAATVAMTAPVHQQSSQTIAMTAPVMGQPNNGKWQVQFVMPSEYTMESLPKPDNPDVALVAVEEKRFAVIRFSGTADELSLREQTTLLQTFLETNHLSPIATPTYAFFNPPWTLPILRRNEVMIEIARD